MSTANRPGVAGVQQSTITSAWTATYVREAIVSVIDALLLCDRIQIVCPIENGAAIIPEYSRLVPACADFVAAVINGPARDSGTLDLALVEWLDEGKNRSDAMFARAYNGQYGDVALRLSPGDYANLQRTIEAFNVKAGSDERFAGKGALESNLLFRAYDALAKAYKVHVGELFRNRADVVLPPLTTTLLSRLPERPPDETFVAQLLKLRAELAPVRQRFAEFQSIDDERQASIADAEKIMNAIGADAQHFARKWKQNLTDNAVVQFCIDNLSFLVKLILKSKDLDPAEIAAKVARISPALEKRLRSSAPSILSQYALKTRRIKGIAQLMERKFGLQLDAAQEQ